LQHPYNHKELNLVLLAYNREHRTSGRLCNHHTPQICL